MANKDKGASSTQADKATTRTTKAERLKRLPPSTHTIDDAGMVAAAHRGPRLQPTEETMAVDPTIAAKPEFTRNYTKGSGKTARPERVALVDGFEPGSKEQKAAMKAQESPAEGEGEK